MSKLSETAMTVLLGQTELVTSSVFTDNFVLAKESQPGWVLTSTDESGTAEWVSAVGGETGAVANVVIASPSPSTGQFSTIALAIASITDASSTNPYVILLGPGVYNEENLVVPSYVCIWGHNKETVIVKALTGANPVFTMNDNSYLRGISIDGNTNAGVGVDAATLNPLTLTLANVLVRDASTAILLGDVSSEAQYYLNEISVIAPSVAGIHVDGTGTGMTNVIVHGFEFRAGAAGPPNSLVVDGANSNVTIQDGTLNGTGVGTSISITNSGSLLMQNVAFSAWAVGVQTPADGGTPVLKLESVNFDDSVTTELDIVNTATGGFLFSEFNDLNKFNIPLAAPFYIFGEPGETVSVAKKGGDFTTVAAALAYVISQSPSASAPWTITVASGQYTEANPLVFPQWTNLIGAGVQITRFLPADPSQDLFEFAAQDITFRNFSASGCTGANAALFRFDGGNFTSGPAILQDVLLTNSTSILDVSNTNGPALVQVINMTLPVISLVSRRAVRFTQTTDSAFNPMVCQLNGIQSQLFVVPTVANPFTFLEIKGFAGAPPFQFFGRELIVFQEQMVSETVGLLLENVVGNLSGFRCVFAKTMIEYPSSSLPVFFNASGLTALNCTNDVIISTDTASGSLQGIMDPNKIDESGAPAHNVNFLIQNVNGGVDLTGEFSVGARISDRTNLLPAIQGDITIGVYTGGELSATGGLNISVAPGTGYVTSGSPSDPLVYVVWDSALTTAVPADTDRYVSVTSAGALVLTAGPPNTYNNVFIGRVKTDATGVLFIEKIPAEALHSSTLFDQTFREAFGTVVSSGLITSAGTGNYQATVTSGNYFYSTHKFSPSGGTDVSFIEIFRSGGVFTNNPPTNMLSAAEARRYDNGTNLVALVATEYAKHTLYVVNDGSDETYVFLYGQETFADQNDAENGALPTPPSFMSENFTPIAGLIVSDTSTNWVVVQDVRPTLSFRSAGVTATSDHGSLAGLLDDDHTQYLLVNGSRAYAGTLDMNTNNIVNAGTINGVTITSLASRLQPGGADPLSAATTPVTIGTTNSVGSSNDLARADHLHAHGAQTDPAMHAVATTGVNGFMSAADKTLLDGATSAATASTLMLPDGSGNVTVNQLDVATAGALRLANTANSQFVAISAPAGLVAGYTLVMPTNDGIADQFLQTNGSGTLTWATPSAGSSALVVKVRSNDTVTDINQVTPTTITWGITDILDGSAYTILGGNQTIQVVSTARYEIHASVAATVTANNTNFLLEIAINGTPLAESSRNGFSRTNGGNSTTSVDIQTIVDLTAGDGVTITTTQVGNAGAATMISGESCLYIKTL